MHTGQGQSYSAESEVQPTITEELFELKGILEEAWPRMRTSGLVCEVAPAAGGDAGGEAGDAGGEAGQGDGLGLYDLTTVPEHLRPVVEPELKKIEANVTKRFEEAAAFRKQWEPFSTVEGLTELQPDALKELVDFHREVLSDPEGFKQWWTELGQEAGWMQNVSGGDGEDGDDFEAGNDSPEISSLREQVEQLTSAVQQLTEGHQQTQQQSRTDAAKQAINAELETLAGEHLGEGQKFDDDTREAILTFALRYPQDPDAVKKGFADLQKLNGKSQVELVKDKLEQPGGGAPGGPPDTSPTQITSFAQAKEAAKQRRLAGVGN